MVNGAQKWAENYSEGEILSADIATGIVHIRFEVFTAVTMKNIVFWDIKTLSVLHRRHITFPLQRPES
jgi:hypothetical protein